MNNIWVTDATTGGQVFINTSYITAVFEAKEGAPEGAVAIVGLTNGIIAVTESVDRVVELIRGA
mgnify:CR=1 FL=1